MSNSSPELENIKIFCMKLIESERIIKTLNKIPKYLEKYLPLYYVEGRETSHVQ